MKISGFSALTTVTFVFLLFVPLTVGSPSQQIELSCSLSSSTQRDNCSSRFLPGQGSCPALAAGQTVAHCFSSILGFWIRCAVASSNAASNCSGSVYLEGFQGVPIEFYQGFSVQGSMSSGVFAVGGSVNDNPFTCSLTPPSSFVAGTTVHVAVNCPATSPLVISTLISNGHMIYTQNAGYSGIFTNVTIAGN